MGNKCALCKSGRKGSTYHGSYFKFPMEERNPLLRKRWLDAVPYADWTPPKNARLCELYFSSDDIGTERRDATKSRNDERGELKYKYLKENVVPHIWPECPAYLSKHVPERRSESTTAESRSMKENDLNQKRLNDALNQDRVESIQDIQKKLDRSMVPDDIQEVMDCEGNLVFFSLVTLPLYQK